MATTTFRERAVFFLLLGGFVFAKQHGDDLMMRNVMYLFPLRVVEFQIGGRCIWIVCSLLDVFIYWHHVF